jgi:undecaprenyl-diphosphatase
MQVVRWRGPERSLPASPAAIGLAAGLYGAVCVVALKVHDRLGPLRVDLLLARVLDRGGRIVGPGLLRALVWTGSPAGLAVASLALTAVVVARRDLRWALVTVVGPVGAELLTERVLKPMIDRGSSGGAFPSGHATAVAALAVAALLVLERVVGGRRVLLAVPALGLWLLGVTVALVDLRYHEPTDVAAGLAVGAATVLVAFAVVARRRPAQS